jgi:hypothetical protein
MVVEGASMNRYRRVLAVLRSSFPRNQQQRPKATPSGQTGTVIITRKGGGQGGRSHADPAPRHHPGSRGLFLTFCVGFVQAG